MELKFALAGANGVFMPLVLDLREGIDLPEGSVAYDLFRERVTPSLSASDLLS